MTIFYGDYSSFQAGVDLSGTVAACIKATEGTFYSNPAYGATRTEAIMQGAYVFAYHFLRAGNGDAQADFYYSQRGNRPVMVDWEVAGDGSHPSLTDMFNFINGVNNRGGRCHLAYIPHWFWQQVGSPDLTGLRQWPVRLVSSQYTAYSDTGPGWFPYGGMYPQIWQYTDNFSMNGTRCDFNAFRGTVQQLADMAETGALPQ
jgi:GH25 family lysozyme M1 (1,4-beta-N-acetylmuramidase)